MTGKYWQITVLLAGQKKNVSKSFYGLSPDNVHKLVTQPQPHSC